MRIQNNTPIPKCQILSIVNQRQLVNTKIGQELDNNWTRVLPKRTNVFCITWIHWQNINWSIQSNARMTIYICFWIFMCFYVFLMFTFATKMGHNFVKDTKLVFTNSWDIRNIDFSGFWPIVLYLFYPKQPVESL